MVRKNHHRKCCMAERLTQLHSPDGGGKEKETDRSLPRPWISSLHVCLITPATSLPLISPTGKMDSLLRWSIEHSTPRSADAPPPARKDLDPGIIDHLLGKPDAVLMKETLEVALDEKRDESARIQALDDFEMLVEHIDNANGTHPCCVVSSLRSGIPQTRS